MKIIKIKSSKIRTWKSFHKTFASLLNFPEHYGENLDAWIDCMEDLNELTVLNFGDCRNLKREKPEIIEAILECSASVNNIKIERGEEPLLLICAPLGQPSPSKDVHLVCEICQ